MSRATHKPERDTFRWLWFFLFLAGCTGSEGGGDEYEIINTGVESGRACWNDDKRLIVLHSKYVSASHQNEPQGLYYIDVAEPKKLNPIDLSPLTLTDLKQITRIECQDETMLVRISTGEHAISRVYAVKIDQPPELLSEMRGGPVSLKGQYVIGNSRVVNAGVLERHDDCTVRYLKPGFKALCWDIGFEMHWPLSQFVLAEYRWEETIQVRGDDGKPKTIKNPEELRLKDGKPIFGQLELRDLDNRMIRPISMTNPNNVSYVMPAVSSRMRVSPDEKFLYTPCARIGDHDAKFTIYDRMCRQSLSSSDTGGNEVFSLHQNRNNDIGIGDFSIAKTGDIYFAGGSKNRGIWKFSASAVGVVQWTNPPPYHNEGSPQGSPDGMRVNFTRPHNGQTTLFIANRPN